MLEFTADPIINSKIKAIVAGLPRSISKLFLEFPTNHNKELVADFLNSCVKQENISLSTKRAYLVALAYLIEEVKKPLELVTSSDLKIYLDSMQKSRAEDPDESWINTQRTYGFPLEKFYKWLAYPQLTPQERKKLRKEQYPEVLQRFVLQSKKGSKTPVKTSDKWNLEDVAIFLKYCTDNPKLRFYHALAWETSGRPGELHVKRFSVVLLKCSFFPNILQQLILFNCGVLVFKYILLFVAATIPSHQAPQTTYLTHEHLCCSLRALSFVK